MQLAGGESKIVYLPYHNNQKEDSLKYTLTQQVQRLGDTSLYLNLPYILSSLLETLYISQNGQDQRSQAGLLRQAYCFDGGIPSCLHCQC